MNRDCNRNERFLFSGRCACAYFVSIGFALFFGACNTCFNFAVVCMVKQSPASKHKCFTELLDYREEFIWSKTELASVLAAYYWASALTLLIFSFLIPRLGLKAVFFICGAATSCATLAIPAAAVHIGWPGVLAARLFAGAFAATNRPLAIGFTANWATAGDRGIITNIVANGDLVGFLIAQPVAGVLCKTLGWQYIFYLFGGVSLFWVFVGLYTVTFEPETNRCISEEEKGYIVTNRARGTNHEVGHIPWTTLLLSPAVLASLVPYLACRLMTIFSSIFVPTYMKEVLSVNITRNGIYSALPFLAQIIGRYITGYMVDKFQFLNPTDRLKLFNTTGSLLGAALLISLSLTPCGEQTLSVVLFVVYNFVTSLINGGCVIAPLFFAPFCSAQVQILFSFFVYIESIILPYVVTLITVENTATEWAYLFCGFATFTVLGALMFLIWGTGEPQPNLVHDDRLEERAPLITECSSD